MTRASPSLTRRNLRTARRVPVVRLHHRIMPRETSRARRDGTTGLLGQAVHVGSWSCAVPLTPVGDDGRHLVVLDPGGLRRRSSFRSLLIEAPGRKIEHELVEYGRCTSVPNSTRRQSSRGRRRGPMCRGTRVRSSGSRSSTLTGRRSRTGRPARADWFPCRSTAAWSWMFSVTPIPAGLHCCWMNCAYCGSFDELQGVELRSR